jgi:hypothetical protein
MGFVDRLSGTTFKSAVEHAGTALSPAEVEHLFAEYQALPAAARSRVDAWLAKRRPELRKLLKARRRAAADAFEPARDTGKHKKK